MPVLLLSLAQQRVVFCALVVCSLSMSGGSSSSSSGSSSAGTAVQASSSSSASSSCPPRCECSEAAHTVKCVAKELRGVPRGIPAYTRNLFITGNRLGRIGADSFRGLDNVTTLSLSNNRIWEVEAHTFSGMRSLRSLDLSNNQLASIHPEAFSVMATTTTTTTHHNTTSSSSSSSSPPGPLRELNLSRALYNHSSVAELSSALRWSSLGGLQVLDLSGNGLIFLPTHTFSHLGSLRRLQLSNNSLVAVHNATFQGLDGLEELDLSLNSLRTLSEEALGELDASLPAAATLLLGQNPWTCACGLIEPLAAWLNRSRWRVRDADTLRCSFPADMRNVSLLALAAAAHSPEEKQGEKPPPLLGLSCQSEASSPGADLALQTSYVFLGIVLGLVGLVFLFVLYLNRRGIKKRVYDLRDACREVWEGYHYRYEMDTSADPRLSQASSSIAGADAV